MNETVHNSGRVFKKILGLSILLLIFCPALHAQYDSIPAVQKKPGEHSPKTASILSAVIPGAGQVYNRQYWKVPLVYAGLAIPAYYISYNVGKFREYKQALLYAQDSTAKPLPQYIGKSRSYLSTGLEFYRHTRDYSILFITLAYVFNIVDASVYAHLFNFDVSEDISLNIRPYNNFSAQPAYGMRLVMNF